ncbi:mucin-2 isoform X9 [Apis cerana]|uniref:mucin-2 isoform X9 n=1 Tax=Apis cerana TaxID=7461 RepID=UPI002B22492B|nr:mucin-2 isoform X9 [Apis cerana]
MVGRFSWCTTVVALVVLLLFVTTEGLRERSQLDDPKTTNRGTLRYHSKSLEEATTASTSTSRSRTARDRSVQSKRFSNLERSNEVSTQPSVIDFESKFDSTKNSIVRTTRTTERDISATEIKNDSRRASSRKVTENVKSVDSPINRRNGKRYFSETNEEAKLKDDNDQTMGTTKGISRRTFNRKSSNSSTERLDNKGPSVFLATTESSRSRTGRKIQTTYSMKDLKTQIPTSRRYTNKKFEDETTTVSFKRGRSTTERIEKSTRSGRSKVINTKENNSIQRRGPDPLLSESESVRVDIPLAVDTTQNPVPDVTTTFGVVASQRRSDVKESSKSNGRTGSSERSKNRGRLNDSETAGSSRSASRRGSSKFSDSTTAENNEQIVSSRRNTISRDRSRSSDTKRNSTTESRSRSRGRNLENNGAKNGGSLERDVKRKVAGERNSERRSRISEAATRIIENQDGQDTRGRSKGRMSRTDTTTPIITDVTTIVALDTTISNNDVTTTDSEVMATTIKPITSTSSRISVRTTSSTSSTPITESSGRGRGRGRNSSQGRKSKEDFFNHGLGFRGRKVLPEGFLNDTTDWRKSSRNEFQSHGNPGWTLRRRPAHLNNFENSSGTSLLSAREQTNEVIPPNEQSTTDIVTTESFSSRRGFKKLQTTEESSTMAGTTTKSYRRGNKTFGLSKTIAEDEESDNYPPEFKAKLKNINTKIPAPKTTSRTPLEEQRKNNYGRRSRKNSMAVEPDDLETAASANILTDESLIVNPLTLINGTGLRRVKKSSASLFAERSRKKLELARRLVKPELNIEENDLDATTASSFSKPKPTGVPVVDETSKVAKYAKPKATGGRNRTSTPLQTSWEEASVKASKLSSPRKGLEDSSKVTGRPYNLSKGRIIGEQIVTSISVEETPIEETTKPYANLPYTNPSIIGFAEEGAATTVDSTRIRPGNARGGKKSREESSVSSKNAKVSLYSTRRAEDIEPVTTIKPKKSYFSRNSKLQEQSTTVEQNSTTSKKSYGSAQRKSQAFQEEDLSKKSKFGSGVTKPTFRPRYIKRTKDKFLDERTTIDQPTIITKIPVPTSRYSRKKSAVKSVDDKSKSVITEGSQSQTKKLEFRPRTATYRRHSEVPTTLVGSTPKIDGVGVAITPRSAKYHATLKTSTVSSQSVGQEPQVNLRIANESAQETTGITGSSNGDSGNSNIFNPTKSTILAANNTLLEQLRSTVAPLLNSLGNRTPVFSGSYSNVNNANSSPRITPNGQPPRFSARYKGAELFVRKQNNIYQPTVPSVTSSSTTPVTPIENTGSAPPIDVSNPGQSKFLTLYQALESASIRNEQLLRNMSGQQQEGRQVGMVPQDTTSTTAQGTAGSGVGQTTEITTPTIQDSSTVPSSTFESSASSSLSTDSTVSSSVETTTTTTTTTMTSTERVPDGGTSTLQTTRMDVFTVTPVTETTTTVPTTTVNIEENLISTGPTSTTETTTTTVSSVINGQGGTNDATSIAPESTTSSETTNAATTIASSTSPSATPSSQTATTPYLGRFGGSRLTPAPRFSLSSTTKAPLRDYLVYGIYPNKTIVRKRPEDNLIDARNVDSPYVIFGIFPDGRLVRKFPNGTIIPDPPRSPVEVVFSLSTTTTTNRPPPRPYYNQANQGTYNQYRGPVYYNNGIPVAEPMRNVQSPGTVDLGLTGNAIVGPNGGGPDNTGPLGTPASTNEMSNALLNTQMGTASVTPIVSTGRPPTVLQGGRIVQDRERDEATRTKEAGGQRSSVYIGQDKFVNYWTNGASTTNPRALSVNINSVASAANVGPSPSVPSFDNLLNNQPGNQVTAPPGFPWRDPLDQIFGITTSSPVITASVASNTLDDTMESNNPALPRPINPYVEVFTPFSSVIGVPRGNIGTIPPPPVTTSITSTIPISTTSSSTTTTTSMTNAPMTTTTTTMAPTTTTSTTTMAPTTTTTMAPTTTTTTTTMASTTTTMAPTTTSTTTTTAASTSEPATATQTNVQMMNLLNRPQQNAFGTSIDDLVFLNSLLQNDSRNSTQRTLTQVEQLLANKILSLALNQAGQGSTRAPKAISIENATPNSIFESASTSRPIVIDLSPSTTTTTTWKTAQTQKSTDQKSIISGSTPEQLTWKPVITTTSKKDVETNTVSTSSTAKISQISTTKAPATMKVKSVTTSRPRTTTTQAPLGFGSLLWQTLFGGGLFASTTTPKPVKAKSVKTTPKSVDITPKPIQTTQKLETITVPSTTTLKTVDISKIQVSSPNSIIEDKLVASSIPISTTKKPLINNPNPRLPNVVTSTYSPEEDAKFLVELLRAVEQDNKAGSSKKTKLTQDDESFLRAILNGRGLTTTMPSSTTEISNAALLAALLKAQGIEPSTPATNIREQLQLAGLGQSVTESTAAKPATITTRPASSGATRPTDTTKKTVTPRPTSAPRIRTTTWSPSSTYPPSLFSSFSNYGTPVQSPGRGDNSGNSALFGATRAFSQFLGAAISGAAQQLQSLVRNGTRIVSEVMG